MDEQESKYFKMGKALNEVKAAHGAQETAVSTVKLVGKGMFNVGRFAFVKVLPAVMEQVARQVQKSPTASEEQLDKAKQLKEKAKEHRQKYE